MNKYKLRARAIEKEITIAELKQKANITNYTYDNLLENDGLSLSDVKNIIKALDLDYNQTRDVFFDDIFFE